jgi:hypothetical protein
MFTNRVFPAALAALAATVLSAFLALGFTANRADAPAAHAQARTLAAATYSTDPWG